MSDFEKPGSGHAEPLAYAIENDTPWRQLRSVSQRLNDPQSLSFDERRDLANLIDLIMSQAMPISPSSIESASAHWDTLGRLLKYVQAICDSGLSWDDKFDLIFSKDCSSEVSECFRALNVAFEYHDPDGSCEDDTRAFANAFESRMRELNQGLQS